MGWVGKIIGGALGLAAAGPIGALLGATLGHGVDRGLEKLTLAARLPPGNRQRIQSAFFTATFSMMGHMSKVDGRVSPAEIALAEAVMAQMQLTPAMRSAAIGLFRQGKHADFDPVSTVDAFRRECQGQRLLIQMFLEVQLQAAYVDGPPTRAQRRVLEQIRVGLRLSELLFRQIENLIQLQRQFGTGPRASNAGQQGRGRQVPAPSLPQAYALLGVSPKDSDAVITKAYRRLLSQHHPDKLVSKGLPEEMMKLAAQKTHEIRRAYEMIQQARVG
ncbi:MAG: co-chaperone DjlA [Chromatiaceae bacterium]|nr:MAG: co-chaperone DjlA [Chromatiaceae bacterium]